ncbi:MAG: isocitrate lyase/phosphoenolpyruvate mutase family protein [Pseudomonadota bacterium]
MSDDKGAAFRALHVPGDPFILANAWDAGSAKMLAALGAQAIATSSAAHAFTMGRPDGGTVTRDEALAHAQDLMAAVDVPVSGDFENGFGDDPDTCAETVRFSAEIGLAGICIEDTDFERNGAYTFDFAVERIRAAAAAARALPQDFVFVARADGVLTGEYGMEEALKRVAAFDEAGADCLYVPMPPGVQSLKNVVRATEKPVNALAAGQFSKLTRAEYAAAGVARISLGSALARVTHRVIAELGTAMFEHGDFSGLAAGMGGDAVDKMLGAE